MQSKCHVKKYWKKTNTMKDWMSQGKWAKKEERKKIKESVNNSKTRQQKHEANKKYQEKDREVKQHCKKDKRKYVNQLFFLYFTA